MDKSDLKKHRRFRKTVQAGFGILSNAYLKGFAEGTIYKGPLKNFCVPGMNCYSCPGALGACPIGAMQSVFDGRKRKLFQYTKPLVCQMPRKCDCGVWENAVTLHREKIILNL